MRLGPQGFQKAQIRNFHDSKTCTTDRVGRGLRGRHRRADQEQMSCTKGNEVFIESASHGTAPRGQIWAPRPERLPRDIYPYCPPIPRSRRVYPSSVRGRPRNPPPPPRHKPVFELNLRISERNPLRMGFVWANIYQTKCGAQSEQEPNTTQAPNEPRTHERVLNSHQDAISSQRSSPMLERRSAFGVAGFRRVSIARQHSDRAGHRPPAIEPVSNSAGESRARKRYREHTT